jgi:hypothetical protein
MILSGGEDDHRVTRLAHVVDPTGPLYSSARLAAPDVRIAAQQWVGKWVKNAANHTYYTDGSQDFCAQDGLSGPYHPTRHDEDKN